MTSPPICIETGTLALIPCDLVERGSMIAKKKSNFVLTSTFFPTMRYPGSCFPYTSTHLPLDFIGNNRNVVQIPFEN